MTTSYSAMLFEYMLPRWVTVDSEATLSDRDPNPTFWTVALYIFCATTFQTSHDSNKGLAAKRDVH
jgi:hypothetical protein